MQSDVVNKPKSSRGIPLLKQGRESRADSKGRPSIHIQHRKGVGVLAIGDRSTSPVTAATDRQEILEIKQAVFEMRKDEEKRRKTMTELRCHMQEMTAMLRNVQSQSALVSLGSSARVCSFTSHLSLTNAPPQTLSPAGRAREAAARARAPAAVVESSEDELASPGAPNETEEETSNKS